MRPTARALLRDVWQLARPYWFSEERWSARGLLAIIVAMNLGMVALNVRFNSWYNAFYNSLQNKDEAEFFRQLLIFFGLAIGYIIIAVYQIWLNQLLQIRWRRWLTGQFLGSWLGDTTYYRLQVSDRTTDNPDQRIAEDLRDFVRQTLTLTLGLMNAAVTLVSFVAILWGLSGPLGFTVAGIPVVIPGYMVFVAVVYAIAGTTLTHLIGRPLVRLNFDRQRFEADFRYSLVRFRENVEGVALYHGEPREQALFQRLFGNVIVNWRAIMSRQKWLTSFTAAYAQVATVFPFMVAAPRYFSGAIQLGGLMQISSAFGQVQTALSWFVEAYVTLADWTATVERLTQFRTVMDAAKAELAGPEEAIERAEGARDLTLDQLSITLPGGRVLLRDASLRIAPGEAIMLAGPSGSGKSTLFRAVAGLWRRGRGRIQVPVGARVLFLPQKAYLPIGSLREVVAYPSDPAAVGDPAIGDALTAAGLPGLVDRLDEVGNWSQILSPGEQQRLAVARAVICRPDWLFLDEATASLDPEAEAQLYRLLRTRLPAATIFSIGHRTTLMAFHDRLLTLGGGTIESRSLLPVEAAS